MRPFFLRAALPAALLLAATPAAAQIGNQTDLEPPGVGAAAGSFLGPGMRTENEMFARAGDKVVFRNAGTGCALRTALDRYVDSVTVAPRTPSQVRVLTLMGALPGNGDVEAVRRALADGADPGSALDRAALRLARAVEGLMRISCDCVATREEYTEAPQWREAISAFNDYVNDAPESALAPPAPELVAIHEALQQVIQRTLSTRRTVTIRR